MKKIFISHSHLDGDFAYEVINFLEAIGIPSENIFCSSAHGYGVPLGDDFLSVIKKWLKDDVVVIFLLSQHYYQSPVSLCEMGASWISAKKVFPIIIPPLNFSDFKGVFPTTIAFMINESIKWIEIKEELEKIFEIKGKRDAIWERKKEEILKRIGKLINSKREESISEELLDRVYKIKEEILRNPIALIFESYKLKLIKEEDLFKKIAETFSIYNSKFQIIRDEIPNSLLAKIKKTVSELQVIRACITKTATREGLDNISEDDKKRSITLLAEFCFIFEDLIDKIIKLEKH